ncbi:MAG: hypothetical protein QM802_01010 [Agriterribacter sp.]
MKCIFYKTLLIFFLSTISLIAVSQKITAIGLTGAWLNHRQSVAGGLSVTVQKELIQENNSSLSVGTNIKVGIEDKLGSGVVIPVLVYWYGNAAGSHMNKDSTGGKIHLFLDLPLLLHYNVGFGSAEGSLQKVGFYFGGGATYILTGYTNEAGHSKQTNFAGMVADGGIRFRKGVDINYAAVFPFKKQIGPIANPYFSEITLSLLL